MVEWVLARLKKCSKNYYWLTHACWTNMASAVKTREQYFTWYWKNTQFVLLRVFVRIPRGVTLTRGVGVVGLTKAHNTLARSVTQLRYQPKG